MEKAPLPLREPENALAWIEAFKARCRAEKKTDIVANPEAAPPVIQDLQITDQFLFRCGVECLRKVANLVAPREPANMQFKDIEKVLRQYLEPQQRLTIAEQTKFVSLVKAADESKADYLARLREAARFCEFEKLKEQVDPSEYMIRLRFIAGLDNYEEKMKVLDELQQKPATSTEELLQYLQKREQAIAFSKPTGSSQAESVAFTRKSDKR